METRQRIAFTVVPVIKDNSYRPSYDLSKHTPLPKVETRRYFLRSSSAEESSRSGADGALDAKASEADDGPSEVSAVGDRTIAFLTDTIKSLRF